VVPGNHDVPLYNLFLRFFSPYKKFLRYLGPFAQNYFEDENVAVYGLWTTNNFSIQSGGMSKKDINRMTERFTAVPTHKMKIIACHHPIENDKNLKLALALNPDFILWGHEHQSRIQRSDKTIMLASGTSASTRTRTEANSFNYITVENDKAVIEIYRHSKLLKAFEVIDRQEFIIS
jgi:predicted phosphodiesterase